MRSTFVGNVVMVIDEVNPVTNASETRIRYSVRLSYASGDARVKSCDFMFLIFFFREAPKMTEVDRKYKKLR